ncbi:FAD-dependent oxidoreductase [Nocardia flavorosea]|uniref:oxidoreductase n=1 Tax=Nocardia flavorosea TaxID=53429 RepID=UPI0018955280|nr:FAD-dependent oxidoreductase [Nocardia flavorosea]MBF6348293.1 FAD-dependent oxidoreductase [Nocardia flavorosea]
MVSPLLSSPFRIGGLELRNRLVATAHGSGVVSAGAAQPGDDDYWRRCAAGGAAMVIAGGTVVASDSGNRTGNITDASLPDAVPGLRRRARAITEGGAVPVCQLVHLGRETLGAEIWEHPVAPSAVRSPREPVRARVMSDADIDRVIADFVRSSRHATAAGFAAVELHAAHGYLLAQFLSPVTNIRADAVTPAGRAAILHRLHAEITAACPGVAVGVRVSVDGAEEAGLDADGLCELLPLLDMFDYLNITAGVRTTYVRDMATTQPPLLPLLGRLRTATTRPLLVSQAFRSRPEIEGALAAGADLAGMARPFVADPEFAAKLLRGNDSRIRPCVSCNEDCRSFTPVLLCTVNPTLAPPGHSARPARPVQFGRPHNTTGRVVVAVVGAGPAGLEAALRLASSHEVTLFDADPWIGGQLRIAAQAPNRTGWSALLRYYQDNLGGVRTELGHRVSPADLTDFDEIIVATGATEAGTPGAVTTTSVLTDPRQIRPGSRVVVVDDGFGYWPALGAVEAALTGGAGQVTVLTPGPAIAAGIPAESRVQLLRRLAGRPVDFIVQAGSVEVSGAGPDVVVGYRTLLSGESRELTCARVVVAGERIATEWRAFPDRLPQARVQIIGDALVPRRVSHAVAEGYAAAETIIGGVRPVPADAG